MKILKVATLVFIVCFFFYKAQSQTGNFVRDSLYVLICRNTFENGRPETAYLVFKHIDSFPSFSRYIDRGMAICALFKSSIFFEEPFFTIQKNMKLYGFISKRESNVFFEKLTKKIAKLNKKYSIFQSKRFENNKRLQIECAKIIADFWVIDMNADEINNTNHSIRVNKECYSNNYWYDLKDLEWAGKLNKAEINYIKIKIEH